MAQRTATRPDAMPSQQQSNLLLGAGLMTLAFLMNTTQSSISKVVRDELGGPQFALHVFSFALLILFPIVVWRRGQDFKTQVLRLHLLRGLVGGVGFLLFFTSVQLVDLVNATVVLNTAPILIPLIAWLALGQEISRGLWVAIAVGFLGLITVVQPSPSLFSQPGILLAFAGAIAGSVEFLMVRRLDESEPALTQVLYYLMVSFVLAFAASVRQLRMPSPTVWLWMVGAAIAILSFQFLLVRAISYAEPHQLGVFQYTSVIFSAIIGWAFFNEIPGLVVMGGIALVCAGGVAAVVLEDGPNEEGAGQ
ncbi:MAG: DMT family transporter [Cyanobacteria bacterium P01_A01_bin.135]